MVTSSRLVNGPGLSQIAKLVKNECNQNRSPVKPIVPEHDAEMLQQTMSFRKSEDFTTYPSRVSFKKYVYNGEIPS